MWKIPLSNSHVHYSISLALGPSFHLSARMRYQGVRKCSNTMPSDGNHLALRSSQKPSAPGDGLGSIQALQLLSTWKHHHYSQDEWTVSSNFLLWGQTVGRSVQRDDLATGCQYISGIAESSNYLIYVWAGLVALETFEIVVESYRIHILESCKGFRGPV